LIRTTYRGFIRWIAKSLEKAGYDGDKLLGMLAEDLREFALLWIVFANLDKLVNDHFVWGFATKQTLGGIAIWLIGARLEMKRKREAEP
jgi:hypothetical protein